VTERAVTREKHENMLHCCQRFAFGRPSS